MECCGRRGRQALYPHYLSFKPLFLFFFARLEQNNDQVSICYARHWSQIMELSQFCDCCNFVVPDSTYRNATHRTVPARQALEPTGPRFLTAAMPPHQLRHGFLVHTQPNTVTRCRRAFRAQRNEDPGRNGHAQNLENIDLNVVHTGDTSTRTSETPMLFNAKVVPPVNPSLKEILSATGFRSTQKQSTLSRTLEQMIHRSL